MTNVEKMLLTDYREMQARIGGCSDGYCCIKRPVGMQMNGGCRCTSHMDHLQSQRVALLLRYAQEMAAALEAMGTEQ